MYYKKNVSRNILQKQSFKINLSFLPIQSCHTIVDFEHGKRPHIDIERFIDIDNDCQCVFRMLKVLWYLGAYL